jgi:3-mercaptopyruvate sulfurtransferase SseA
MTVTRPVAARRRKVAPARSVLEIIRNVGIVIAIVAVAVFAVTGHARVAVLDAQRRGLEKEQEQLDRKLVELNLKIDGMSARPKIIARATQHGFVAALPDHRHAVATVEAPPSLVARRQAEQAEQTRLAARSNNRLVAFVQGTWDRLIGGPGHPAYAHP